MGRRFGTAAEADRARRLGDQGIISIGPVVGPDGRSRAIAESVAKEELRAGGSIRLQTVGTTWS